jgi:hypothetical protein
MVILINLSVPKLKPMPLSLTPPQLRWLEMGAFPVLGNSAVMTPLPALLVTVFAPATVKKSSVIPVSV